MEMDKFPLWAGREKLGYGYVCSLCDEIRYYEGKFRWEGWEARTGTQGYGIYYQGKGIRNRDKTNRNEAQAFKTVVRSHGLERKEILSQNAYVRDE